jgi:hypothetical protein
MFSKCWWMGHTECTIFDAALKGKAGANSNVYEENDMNTVTMNGTLTYKLTHVKKAPIMWRIRHYLTWSYIWGLVTTSMAKLFSGITGVPTIISELRATLNHNGEITDYGVVGRRCVTTAGVNYLVACWGDTDHSPNDMGILKYHASGTDDTAEAAAQTGLVAECTTQYDTDNTRPAGTLTVGASNNIFSSVCATTFTYAGGATTHIKEHGLLNSATVGAGTLWDRTLTGTIDVVTTDILTWTYQCSFPSGA